MHWHVDCRIVGMKAKLRWLVAIGVGLLTTYLLQSRALAAVIVEAVDWIGRSHFAELAVAAYGFPVVP